MKTKEREEAINFLLGLKSLYKMRRLNNFIPIIDNCIKAIERGGKFEKMWEKFRDSYGRFQLNLIVPTPMWDIMNEFKQKYFPKKVIE